MGPVLMFLAACALGLGGWWAVDAALRAPGDALRRRFETLTRDTGSISGRTYAEITAACGEPCSVSPAGNGKLCQWAAAGWHIALVFDERGVCIGFPGDTNG